MRFVWNYSCEHAKTGAAVIWLSVREDGADGLLLVDGGEKSTE
jgi:hypothetical protein